MSNFFSVACLALGIGAVLALLLQARDRVAHLVASCATIIGSVFALAYASTIVLNGHTETATYATSFPLFNISLHSDLLSALFIALISCIALIATIYGISYMKGYYGAYNIGLFSFFYTTFILSLLLVATAHNGLYFLFVWEIMSLSSLFLVLFENKKAETIKAGVTYFVMTHIATAFIMVAFLLLYKATGSFDFGVIQAHSALLSPWLRTAVLACFLVGFGTKAGIIPLHIWLPRAHSVAPSHVSALMSGVMIKLGILMLVRMFFDILPQPVMWLGYVVLGIGAISSLLGVLYALAEHDSKRLLAYHSIENIGIILLGLGGGLLFMNLHQPALAVLAIAAGLFHTVNHAIFKSLLFLGAGSVIAQTHTRNIEAYGGLIKRMPLTALFFLVGAIAISGLPPFNGFASEWLTFQSIFAGIALHGIATKVMFLFAGGALALTGGLAAACFVKAFGVTFLARPRSEASERATESSVLMTGGMSVLAILCLVVGAGSAAVFNRLQTIVHTLGHIPSQASAVVSTATTLTVGDFAILAMPWIIIGLIAAVVATAFITWLLARQQKVSRGKLWACGYQHPPTARMEITATGFSRTLIIVFKRLFQPTKQQILEYDNPKLRYFTRSNTVTLDVLDIFDTYLYQPLHTMLDVLSQQVKKVQSGNIHQYLLYVFVLLIGLLVWVRL
jgi:hydrogenase-4 component B